MERILGIDLGETRIGISLSDPLGITAQNLPTILYESREVSQRRVAQIAADNKVSRIVVGLPLKMNGEVGPRAERTLRWVEELKTQTDVEILTWDERLTSAEAGRLMIEQGLSRKKQKEKSDELAAILILQNFLDAHRRPTQ